MMKQQHYIHVGPPKTASTFLQRRIFSSMENIYYDKGQLYRHLNVCLRANPLWQDWASVENVISAAEGAKEEKILFSSEGLFGDGRDSYVNNAVYAKVLKRLFPNGKILMIVRRQDAYLESMYKQTLHSGWSIPRNKYIKLRQDYKNLDTHNEKIFYPTMEAGCLNWNLIAENYVFLFGRKNVKVLVFEDLKKNEKSFISELSNFFDEKINISDEETFENKSYSALSSKIAYALNRFIRRPGSLQGFIAQQPYWDYLQSEYKAGNRNIFLRAARHISSWCNLRWILQDKLDKIYYRPSRIYDDRTKNYIMSLYKQSNQSLAENFDLDIKKHGYY